jgi:hypothetical protein
MHWYEIFSGEKFPVEYIEQFFTEPYLWAKIPQPEFANVILADAISNFFELIFYRNLVCDKKDFDMEKFV